MNIYKSSGHYIGFTVQDNIFRWDGKYLGWIDNQNFIWDKEGNFKGRLVEQNGIHYALKNTFDIPPVSKAPRVTPATPVLPTPSSSVAPINPQIGVEDAF